MSRRINTVGMHQNNYSNIYKKNYFHDQNYQYYHQKNQGLPNLGNICFLNSAIQFLYSSLMFRKVFMKQNYGYDSFQYYLKQIFLCIQQEKPHAKKCQILTQIIKHLQNLEESYTFRTQQDCSYFILLILNYIGQKHKEILQLFKLYYWLVCQNCQDRYKKIQYVLYNQTATCQNCEKTMQIQFILHPSCIIFHDFNNPQKTYTSSTVRKQKLEYHLKAKIIYNGNGAFGHYKMSRRKNVDDLKSRFFIFSDQIIYQEQQRNGYKTYETQMLSLYEFQKESESQQSIVKYDSKANLKNTMNFKNQSRNQISDKPSKKACTDNRLNSLETKQLSSIQLQKTDKINLIQFLKGLKSNTLALILLTISKVTSLKQKICKFESLSQIGNLIKKYLKLLDLKETPSFQNYQLKRNKQDCLDSIIKFLRNNKNEEVQKFISFYHSQIKSKENQICNQIEHQIFFFLIIMWNICHLNPQISKSFQCCYQNQYNFQKLKMELFLKRYTTINCQKQIQIEKKFQFIQKPRYIIILQREQYSKQQYLCLKDYTYAKYIMKSLMTANYYKEKVYIKIFQIKDLKLKIELNIKSKNKTYKFEDKHQTKLRKIIDQFQSSYQSNVKQYSDIQLMVNSYPILIQAHLDRPIISLLNCENKIQQKKNRYTFYKQTLRLEVQQSY